MLCVDKPIIILLIWLRLKYASSTLFSEIEGSGEESHSTSDSRNGGVGGGFHSECRRFELVVTVHLSTSQ